MKILMARVQWKFDGIARPPSSASMLLLRNLLSNNLGHRRPALLQSLPEILALL
jgi:hypothetical protein